MARAKAGSTIFASSSVSCFEDRGISGLLLLRSSRLDRAVVGVPLVCDAGVTGLIEHLDGLLTSASVELQAVFRVNREALLLLEPRPTIRVEDLCILQDFHQ